MRRSWSTRARCSAICLPTAAVNTEYAEANSENVKTFFKVADRLNEWVVSTPDEAATEIAPLVGVSPRS